MKKQRTGTEAEPHESELWQWLEELEDIEHWEVHDELREAGDTAALVRCCERHVREQPNDLNLQYELAQAYVENGQPEKAMEFLAPRHHADPTEPVYQHAILDALFASGRAEGDFAWVVRSHVYRITVPFLDACYSYLKQSGRPKQAADLFAEMTAGGYATFSEDEFLESLRNDTRFEIDEAGVLGSIWVECGWRSGCVFAGQDGDQ